MRTQVLCFERDLTSTEHDEVVRRLRLAAEQARDTSSPNFSRIEAPQWEGSHIFVWRTPLTSNPEDRTSAREFSECLQAIESAGIPSLP